jgi:hypothetical protein
MGRPQHNEADFMLVRPLPSGFVCDFSFICSLYPDWLSKWHVEGDNPRLVTSQPCQASPGHVNI